MTELLTNSAFATGTAGWSTSTGPWTNWSHYAPSGHAATGCLKYTFNGGGNQYVYQNIAAPSGGGRYQFNYWTKTDNLAASGIRSEISYYTGPSYVWMCSVQSTNPVSGTSDWTLRSLTTPFIPKADKVDNLPLSRLRVYLYCDGGVSGSGFIDDCSFTQIDDVKFNPMLLDPYDARRLHGNTLRVGYDIWDNPLYLHENMYVKVTVDSTSVSGLTVADGLHELTIDMTGWPDGDYEAVVELYNNSVVAKTHTLPFNKTQELPTVYIDEYKRIIRNGEPFFPIGAYLHNVNQATRNAAITGMVNAGLNTILFTNNTTLSSFALSDEFMDNCAGSGLAVAFSFIYSFPSYSNYVSGYPAISPVWNTATDVASGFAARYKDHEALLCYVVNDERTSDADLAQLALTYEAVHAADPSHPCYSVTSAQQWVPRMVADETALSRNYADIFGIDYYPIKNSYAVSGTTTVSLAQVKSGTQYSRALFPIVEATHASVKVPAQTSLCEVYQAIIGGARGVYFYSWDESLGTDPAATGFAFCTANLAAISPIALGIDSPVQVEAPSGIYKLTRIVGEDLYVIATNATTSAVSATFDIPESLSINRVLVGTPGSTTTVEISSNTFDDVIASYGTQIYQLQNIIRVDYVPPDAVPEASYIVPTATATCLRE